MPIGMSEEINPERAHWKTYCSQTSETVPTPKVTIAHMSVSILLNPLSILLAKIFISTFTDART